MASEINATKDYLTECFLCKKDYSDPRLLPCMHTFCMGCLENYLGDTCNPIAGEIIHCPFCQKEVRIPTEGLIGLKKNFFLERLVKVKTITSSDVNDRDCDECFEDSELTENAVQLAVQYCVQCSQFLCKPCSRIHKRNKLGKDHSLVELGTKSLHVYELLKTNSGTVSCDKHSEEQIQMFCTDCQQFACATCLDEDHQQHTIRSIKRIADDYKNQLRQVIDDVTSCVTNTEKKLQTLVERITEFQTNADDCQKEIVAAVEDLKRLVDAQGKALIDELLSTKRTQLSLWQKDVEELQTHRNLLNHFKIYCSEMETKSTKHDLCDVFGNLSRRSKELQVIHDSDMEALTCFVAVFFEKTKMEDQTSYNIVGKLKETVEVFVMQREIEDQAIEDFTNDTVSDFEHNHVLEPFTQDLEACRELDETADTLLKAVKAAVHDAKEPGVLNEPISSERQPTVALKQKAWIATAFELEPLTETIGTDWNQVASHGADFLYESYSDEHDKKRTVEASGIAGEHTFDKSTNYDTVNEVIDRSKPNTNFVPPFLEELQQGSANSNVTEENVGDTAAQKSYCGRTSDSKIDQTRHSGLDDSVADPIANLSGPYRKHVSTDNSAKNILENIIYAPDISVTEALSDNLTSDRISESGSHITFSSNCFPEVAQNSLKLLKNSEMQKNKSVVCTERRLQEVKGRRHRVKQLNIKAWLTQTHKTEQSSSDELPDLDIEEGEPSPSFDSAIGKEEVESVHEETSCQSLFDNFPLTQYMNATSEIGLGLVIKQVSETEPCWHTDKTLNSSNIQIQPANLTQCSKRKLTTPEPQKNDDSKKLKGICSLELIHKLKTGSSEVFGVTSLQNKIYVLRKKSVSIYSNENPQEPLTNIKLQKAITPFDICACKKSLALYITDYANYHMEHKEKHCIWKITVSEHKVCSWYCGIGEPYTLSVNSAGNVILLRSEENSQQIALEILSDKAELINSICLPDEIKDPEHALETSIGSYVICHMRNGYQIWTVSEVNRNGEIVRRLKGTEQLSEPKHLAMDAEDRVFVADWRKNRVAVLGSSLDWADISFTGKKDDKDGFRTPNRLCYVAEKKQLIVVSSSLKVCVYRVVIR